MATSMLLPFIQKVRIPTSGDKVYKEECVLCYDTPESDSGLYVCMSTFLGFCKKHVQAYFFKTSNSLFLHLKRFKREVEGQDVPTSTPTKLAIGLEGGFNVGGKKYEYEDHNSIVLMPELRVISLPCPDLPESVQLSIGSILEIDAASIQEEADALAGTWDGMQREVTKHADTLVQLDNGVKIPPKDWQCQVCGLKENLWLNLTDGAIHCGRKYFNGQGGNNHAVEHYEKTKYPLVVKLGTITSDASDVYSYDEDNMVIDPNLPQHLAHFGINIKDLQKTDKSMVELEIDLNQRIGEWAIIQESGTKLVPLYGPGYTGLENLGNSCYLNSVMQVLFNIPDFRKCYYEKCDNIFNEFILDAPRNINVQMAKLAYGLWSGEYSKPPENVKDPQEPVPELPGIKPRMFKNLIGQGHPEFSTKRQQDAQEFFLHLISVLERHSRGRENPADSLKFEVEERIQCSTSKKVKYTTRTDYLLSLPIPLDAATNKEELDAFEIKKAEILARGDRLKPDEIVRPRISLQACLDCFSSLELVDDFYSTAINAKSTAYKATRLHTFPDYLMLHLKKFTIGDDWVPKKLDVSLDVPDELDLSALRGKGIQPGEEELPEAVSTEKEFEYNEALLYQLSDMGFPLDACKKALYFTQNEGIDSAMNWVMEHMNDPDFMDPFHLPGANKNNPNFTPNSAASATIVSMGFTPAQAAKALEATDNNLERAVDWIFSHAEEMEVDSPAVPEVKAQFRDGTEKYKLVAFISHMGTSTVAGHYVCHIFKDGRWVIFNDNKVALSENPPKDLAYLYIYQRISSS
ncbi:ubiquitin carboxyl-terminal hydrolase 5 [Nephila pilipes]|uniref:Ubiquitin carboxyl-terminal hydrolase n=1 Tax=Nephila pilipes TaxID=299642 RepID=A0A8X6N880_NEPPI|nr:ubiquitin carboxyl-terminal hydrolase 5 [Nephila pilipes]